MKVLLDICSWGDAARDPSNAGHDVRWMGETEPDPGDAAIMQLAFDEDRVLITLDKGLRSSMAGRIAASFAWLICQGVGREITASLSSRAIVPSCPKAPF